VGHRLDEVLASLQEQRTEIDEALTPLEQQLSSRTLSPSADRAVRRRWGGLRHRREVLTALIADLERQIDHSR
jgi:hypothetical protein